MNEKSKLSLKNKIIVGIIIILICLFLILCVIELIGVLKKTNKENNINNNVEVQNANNHYEFNIGEYSEDIKLTKLSENELINDGFKLLSDEEIKNYENELYYKSNQSDYFKSIEESQTISTNYYVLGILNKKAYIEIDGIKYDIPFDNIKRLYYLASDCGGDIKVFLQTYDDIFYDSIDDYYFDTEYERELEIKEFIYGFRRLNISYANELYVWIYGIDCGYNYSLVQEKNGELIFGNINKIGNVQGDKINLYHKIYCFDGQCKYVLVDNKLYINSLNNGVYYSILDKKVSKIYSKEISKGFKYIFAFMFDDGTVSIVESMFP